MTTCTPAGGRQAGGHDHRRPPPVGGADLGRDAGLAAAGAGRRTACGWRGRRWLSPMRSTPLRRWTATMIKGQLVEVFDAANGKVALEAPASPMLDAGGNVAISPSGGGWPCFMLERSRFSICPRRRRCRSLRRPSHGAGRFLRCSAERRHRVNWAAGDFLGHGCRPLYGCGGYRPRAQAPFQRRCLRFLRRARSLSWYATAWAAPRPARSPVPWPWTRCCACCSRPRPEWPGVRWRSWLKRPSARPTRLSYSRAQRNHKLNGMGTTLVGLVAEERRVLGAQCRRQPLLPLARIAFWSRLPWTTRWSRSRCGWAG